MSTSASQASGHGHGSESINDSSTTIDEPSSDTLKKLRSTEWMSLLQDKDESKIFVNWFKKTQQPQWEKKSLENSTRIDGSNLKAISLFYRFQNEVDKRNLRELKARLSSQSNELKQLEKHIGSLTVTNMLRHLKDDLLRNLLNTKAMYSLFRITPFAASEVRSHHDSILCVFNSSFPTFFKHSLLLYVISKSVTNELQQQIFRRYPTQPPQY